MNDIFVYRESGGKFRYIASYNSRNFPIYLIVQDHKQFDIFYVKNWGSDKWNYVTSINFLEKYNPPPELVALNLLYQ